MQISQSFMSLSADVGFSMVIGILIGYFFYFKQKKEPIACYAIRSLNVIDVSNNSSHIGEKITVSYEDKPIQRVSVASVTFWNGGTSPLSGEKLLPKYPLRICICPNGKLLEATIVTDPNPECECKISFDPVNFPNSVLLNFHHLEPGNGITMQVLHTAPKVGIDVVGKIIGVHLKDVCSSGKKYDSILDVINYSGIYLGAVLLFAFFILVQFHTWIGLPPVFFDFLLSNSPIITKLLLGLCLLATVSGLLISFLKKTTSYKIPNELES
jgi:hypothetical protein